MERTTSEYVINAARDIFAEHVLTQESTGLRYTSSYFGDLYDWEYYFDSVLAIHLGMTDIVEDGLRIFLNNQTASGFIPRHIRIGTAGKEDSYHEFESEEHCKPFLAQAAYLLAQDRASSDWLDAAEVNQLERYLRYWLEDRDVSGSGLSVWSSGPHSGADTQFVRTGEWRANWCEGADLNSYLVCECEALEGIALMKGDGALAGRAADWRRRRAASMQSHLWSESAGFYYDRDARTGAPIEVKTGASFLPLWAGVPTREQAERLVREHLTNTDEFWSPFPIRSMSRSEPAYTRHFPIIGDTGNDAHSDGHGNWNGGWWGHWQTLIILGLRRYGFVETAEQLETTSLRLLLKSGTREWYDSESGAGLGLKEFAAGAALLGAFVGSELRS